MTQDIKQRVEEAKRILNYERPDIQHANDLARVTYHKQDVQYIHELIKYLAAQNEKLVETIRWYADWDNYDKDFSPFSVIQHEGSSLKFESTDQGDKARDTLKSLGINPTDGDV